MSILKSSCSVLIMMFSMIGDVSAAMVTVSGIDVGANSNDPRPNSNAAASLFDALNNEAIFTVEVEPVGAFTNLVLAPDVTMNGVDSNGNPQTIRDSPFGAPDRLYGYNTTAGGNQFISLFGGTLTFTFSVPIEDFGAYFSGVQFDNETISFIGSDGIQHVLTIPNPGADGGVLFFGFRDIGNRISSITIDVNDDIVGIDDIRVSFAPGLVPEPATLALVGIAVASMGLSRRRTSIRSTPG